MDADTRAMLAGSVRALLQSQPADLAAGLAELGWDEAVADYGATAIELLFTEQGKAGVASAALDGVLIAASGGLNPSAARQSLVVHPFGSLASSVGSGRLCVDGVVLGEPTVAGSYVVAADNCAAVYAVPTTSVAPAEPIAGFDPSSSLSRVRFDIAIDDAREHERGWEFAIAAARRALACELIGNGRAMLDIAVEHVGQRHQFGRPIGANQTPRHRLADAYVQLSAARELVQIAYVSDRPWDATVAKTYAGYAVDTTSRACLQVCGAMGLTSEHPLGGYVKRFRTLDALYGSWQQTMRAVGEQLLLARVIPRGVGV